MSPYSYVLDSEQTVSLQFVEGTLFSVGFLLLFFSIYRYRSRRQALTVSGVDDHLFDDAD